MIKTAMEQLIDFAEKGCNPNELVERAIKLLKTEHRQISDAWATGWNDRGNDDGDFAQHKSGSDYYQKTFKSSITSKPHK